MEAVYNGVEWEGSKRGWEGMSGGRGGELKTWRFQFLHKYRKPRISKRFRRHVRNYLNPCSVNDSIKTRQTRLIRGPLRGSILQLFIIIIIIWMIMYLHPHSLNPRHAYSAPLINLPHAFWSIQQVTPFPIVLVECWKVASWNAKTLLFPYFVVLSVPLASITRDIWSWITRRDNCNVFVKKWKQRWRTLGHNSNHGKINLYHQAGRLSMMATSEDSKGIRIYA